MSDQQTVNVKGFTSGRVLARNTVLNLIGQLVPMVVGVVTIPILIRHLGTDRFAVITIAWMLIGYFSLFDMGLGRALTQLIAERIGKNQYEDIPGIFWTSMSLMLAFSIVGALAIAVLASPLVHNVLKVPLPLQSETTVALYIMAISVPFIIMTAALIGVLTAYQRFDIINTIRIPMGTYTYAAPLLILPFSSNLVPIIAALLLGRAVTFVIHLRYCLKIAPDLRTKIVIQKSTIKPLFKFGGWMTAIQIISTFMIYFDRFLIGSIISITAVAYYTTPYELITKLWVIPMAMMSVLLPVFASTYKENSSYAADLFHRAVKYLLLITFPIVFIIVAGAQYVMTLWLGSSFALNSYLVLQWLAIGVFINCFSQVPFFFLQGIGRPDVASKIFISELILYIPLLWFLTKIYGISGAAIAWCIRAAIDAALLFYVTRNYFLPASPKLFSAGLSMLGATISLVFVMYFPLAKENVWIVLLVLFVFLIGVWKILLSEMERQYLKNYLHLSATFH